MRLLAAFVNLGTMSDFYDQDYEFGFLNFVNNTIYTLPYSVLFLS